MKMQDYFIRLGHSQETILFNTIKDDNVFLITLINHSCRYEWVYDYLERFSNIEELYIKMYDNINSNAELGSFEIKFENKVYKINYQRSEENHRVDELNILRQNIRMDKIDKLLK